MKSALSDLSNQRKVSSLFLRFSSFVAVLNATDGGSNLNPELLTYSYNILMQSSLKHLWFFHVVLLNRCHASLFYECFEVFAIAENVRNDQSNLEWQIGPYSLKCVRFFSPNELNPMQFVTTTHSKLLNYYQQIFQ